MYGDGIYFSVAQYCPFTLLLDVKADSERGGRQVLESSSKISNLQSVQNFTERRCDTGKLHFEKTTGYELIRGNPSRLFSDRDGGIIKDCAGRCESDARCMGFNMVRTYHIFSRILNFLFVMFFSRKNLSI